MRQLDGAKRTYVELRRTMPHRLFLPGEPHRRLCDRPFHLPPIPHANPIFSEQGVVGELDFIKLRRPPARGAELGRIIKRAEKSRVVTLFAPGPAMHGVPADRCTRSRWPRTKCRIRHPRHSCRMRRRQWWVGRR